MYKLLPVKLAILSFFMSATGWAQDNWTDRVSVAGDLRLRSEYIDAEDEDTRIRQRIRARIGFTGKVNEDISIGFRIGTSSGASPTTTQTSMDDQFHKKGLYFDRAFLTWTAAENLTVLGGKMPTPMVAVGDNELMWDSDLSPEGFAALYNLEAGPGALFLNLGSFWIEERGASADTGLLSAQLGYGSNNEEFSYSAGIGYHAYANIQGRTFDDNDPPLLGNTPVDPNDASLGYANEYAIMEAFFSVGFGQWLIYANYVQNNEVDDDNTGYLAGFQFGKAKNPGDWKFEYKYRQVEADAIVSAYSDSDFADGLTDSKGHDVAITYVMAENSAAKLRYINAEVGLDGSSTKENRGQLDLLFGF